MSNVHMQVKRFNISLAAAGRRRLAAAGAVFALALLAVGCGSSGATAQKERRASAISGPCEQRLAAAGVRGRFAFLRNGGISILDLPDCRSHVLVARSAATSPLRFSADGRYLAYGHGQVIRAGGAPVPRRPLGRLGSWSWSSKGDELAGATARGGVEIWRPGGAPRALAPAGWGAADVAFAPDGMLAVVRETREPHGAARRANELWSVVPTTGRRRLIYRMRGVGQLAGSGIAGFTPNGRSVLFWPDAAGSASLAADGMPLAEVPLTGGRVRMLVPRMLTYDDYIATCGSSLVVAAGGYRYTTTGKRLVDLTPPSYRATPMQLPGKRSWITPSCSQDGEIAASAAPSHSEHHFGLEHRSIWLLSPSEGKRRPLTSPGPRTTTDELPRISRDGRYVLFAKASKAGAEGLGQRRGTLWAISTGTAHSRPIGPIADIGSSAGYYGEYGWSATTAWHQG